MTAQADALRVLEETSRTFFLPIVRLPKGLQEAVASAYLCLRAIDEVEDHPTLERSIKAKVLQGMGLLLQSQTSVENFSLDSFTEFFASFDVDLPEVTTRVGEWACYAPKFIAPRIWEATAGMADRMAHWAMTSFRVDDKSDLDRYTYGVAGAVGLMLCDIWGWFEKVQIHRSHGIQFGRGLQLVNILRNRQEDMERGVDFYPEGWSDDQMFDYARENLDGFDEYAQTLPKNSFMSFVSIPRALAYATLEALVNGKEKLSRNEVVDIVQKLEVQP
ncbi:MAG: phytoene/squalene synthase family protein [Chloroflexi bacterium]|jgi:farnesyl-diphosphate farnesyltransferase|nr:phytoene/squalene synthase family protein [Chloroflexota bacterium]MBT3670981.1 phytoene/squalene synthase family protein [Chloroflexota bacterium]MBT4001748.1 phytoene/squalene synthase family protein [Chloroflexota bacterium]MBT4305014.1 phytoene/squalene synthase family protein [Chloroflexota bacterium]MBT4533825.1 phytoene/squalene synthase family protein [Chloroflexota bacterium]